MNVVRQIVPQPIVPIMQTAPQPAPMGIRMGGMIPGMQMGMRPSMPGQAMPLAASGMAMGQRPMMPGQISATMPGLRPPIGGGVDMSMSGPPAKKMKPEETLIPEQTFLRQNPPTVTFQVSAPKVEKDDWKCKGQLITISMPLKSTFSEVKQKLEAETGMPPGKQKLQCESIFVKGRLILSIISLREFSTKIYRFFCRLKYTGFLQYQTVFTCVADSEGAWWSKEVNLGHFFCHFICNAELSCHFS